MLIASPRQSADDLESWSRLERQDRAISRFPEFIRRESRALNVFTAFATKPCYIGVSWGKDSVVLAHLAYRMGVATGQWRPLVWVRVEPIANPDCHAVRDEYFLAYPEHREHYHEIEMWCRLDEQGWHATGTLEEGFAKAAKLVGLARHASGVRGEEAGSRKLRMMKWSETSPNTCAPIGWWKAMHVFAYLYKHHLPVHPAYAMTYGGTLDRGRVRVASLGGERGTGVGRREWENHYYGDVQRKIERLVNANDHS